MKISGFTGTEPFCKTTRVKPAVIFRLCSNRSVPALLNPDFCTACFLGAGLSLKKARKGGRFRAPIFVVTHFVTQIWLYNSNSQAQLLNIRMTINEYHHRFAINGLAFICFLKAYHIMNNVRFIVNIKE